MYGLIKTDKLPSALAGTVVSIWDPGFVAHDVTRYMVFTMLEDN